jgi:hypothetical protein
MWEMAGNDPAPFLPTVLRRSLNNANIVLFPGKVFHGLTPRSDAVLNGHRSFLGISLQTWKLCCIFGQKFTFENASSAPASLIASRTFICLMRMQTMGVHGLNALVNRVAFLDHDFVS